METLTLETILQFSKKIHLNNCDKGFWPEDRNLKEARMLIITELSEAVEAHRKSNRCLSKAKFKCRLEEKSYSKKQFQQDWWKQCFEREIKDTVEDELADAFIRCLDILYHVKGGVFNFEAASHTYAENFAENILSISSYVIQDRLLSTASKIYGLCVHMDIDLLWHVRQKHHYNTLRAHKHGKNY